MVAIPNDAVAEFTLLANQYSPDFGHSSGGQFNQVVKSGSNVFHGSLYEYFQNRNLNAADNLSAVSGTPLHPRFDNNRFGGTVGGPIKRNKLFFFFDSEWVRIALPIVTPTTVPSTAFQKYVLQQLPLGGTDSVTGATYAPSPRSVAFYQKMFALYGNTDGTPLAVLGCPLNSDGTTPSGSPPNGNGCANRQSVSHSSDDHEQVQTVRVDYNINQKDTTWFRFQADTGVQAAYTDPINSLFDAVSPQPLYSFAAGYTHVFSQNLVNYFNPAFSWYESLFGPADLEKTLAAWPVVLEGSGANAPFTTVGGLDNTWVQGRRASRFFINANLAWTSGANELRFGTNTRIFRLNDYDFGESVTPVVNYTTLPQFIYGVASTVSKTFPFANSQPYNFLNMDFYVQDTWKFRKNLTIDLGLRLEMDPSPTADNNLLSHPNAPIVAGALAFAMLAAWDDVHSWHRRFTSNDPAELSLRPTQAVSYIHLTLPTIYSV